MSRIGTCVASLLALSVTLACGDDEGGAPAPQPLSFAEDVHPILLQRCAGSDCHSNINGFLPGHAASSAADAYAETQVMSMVPGELVYERIVARTSGMDDFGFMPPTDFGPMPCQRALGAPGCLTVEEFETIEQWIADGALP